MAPGWPRNATPLGLTCTLATLHKYVQEYILDVKKGREKFIVENLLEYDTETGDLRDATPCDPTPETLSRLLSLETKLNGLEKRLRDHEQWHYPDFELSRSTPPTLEFTKLERDISILERIIVNAQSTDPPDAYSLLSLYAWKWDPFWKEFYAESEIANTRMYLSFWRNIGDGLPLDHYVFAHVPNITPELVAGWIGPWDQWMWDERRGEWFTVVRQEYIGVELYVYAAFWRGEGDWAVDWEWVGGMGEIWE